MSGAEAIAVVGLISGVITILETSRNIYDAAKAPNGLHKTFRAVSQNIPLVISILQDCERVQKQADQEYTASQSEPRRRQLEDSANAVRPIMLTCKNDAEELNEIFTKLTCDEDTTRTERYLKAAQAAMFGNKRKVEDLMKDILEKLQLLHTEQYFKNVTEDRSEALDGAIQNLAELQREDPSEFKHYGSGPMNINRGTATQRNYNQSGGNNKQYNADTQNFHN